MGTENTGGVMADSAPHGMIHMHSIYSMFDGMIKPSQFPDIAKRMGAPYVTLTDHGTLLGVPEFMKSCKKAGVKGIPGVEGYLASGDGIVAKGHVLLLPKDMEGYRAICKAVTESNTNIDPQGAPVMTWEMLEGNFGPGTAGHGKAIATSACVGGYLATIALHDAKINEKQAREREKQASEQCCPPDSPEYRTAIGNIGRLTAKDRELRSRRDTLKKVADRKYAQLEKNASRIADPAARKARMDEIAAKKEESRKATADLAKAKEQIAENKKELSHAKELVNGTHGLNARVERWKSHEAAIRELEKGKFGSKKTRELVLAGIERFRAVFGAENFLMEMQCHGLAMERGAFTLLKALARETGVRLVMANDAHMPGPGTRNVMARQILMTERYMNSWKEPSPDAGEYYPKGDGEMRKALAPILDDGDFRECQETLDWIGSQCDVEWEHGSHPPKCPARFLGSMTAEEKLREVCYEAIPERYPGMGTGGDFAYHDRLEYELGVITKMGYADYTLIVRSQTSAARDIGMEMGPWMYVVGPGRGSGAGSMVNYLCHITDIDPMRHNLMFERYLNPERVSMPDIDVDYAPSVRDRVYDWTRQVWGTRGVCKITTIGMQMAKKAVKNAGRVMGLRDTGNSKEYLSLCNSMCKVMGDAETIGGAMPELRRAWGNDRKAMEILGWAELIEGFPGNLSTHAAGVLMSDSNDISDYVPLRYDSEAGWASQCDMVESEADMGLLKMDFLGLKTLDVISVCRRLAWKLKGERRKMEEIPLDDPKVYAMLAGGGTLGVFQLESDGMTDMFRKLRPDGMEDLILGIAAYRPGPMQYIPGIIDVKNGKPANYLIPELEPILSPTYGYPIYQEQIIAVFHDVAGFSAGEADIIRRHMSKKHTDEFMAYHDKTVDGFVARGMKREDAEGFWDELVKFSEYAFNKSHAAVYAYIAYYTAWYKCHYPEEYLTACLCHEDDMGKREALVHELRRLGFVVTCPDINASGMGFDIIDGKVVPGLSDIVGLGSSASAIIAAREANGGRFRGFGDYCINGVVDKKTLECLTYSGAFDCWGHTRAAMAKAIPDMLEWSEKRKALGKKYHADRDFAEGERDSLFDGLEAVTKAMARYMPEKGHPELEDRHEREHGMLGFYGMGHVLDGYASQRGCTPIPRLVPGMEADLMAVFTRLTPYTTKAGREMAFATVDDRDGSMSCVIFSGTWRRVKNNLREGMVMKMHGKCELNDNGEKQFVVNRMEQPGRQEKFYIMFVPNLDHLKKYVLFAEMYQDDSGYPLVIYDRRFGEFRKTGYRMSEKVLDVNFPEGVEVKFFPVPE